MTELHCSASFKTSWATISVAKSKISVRYQYDIKSKISRKSDHLTVELRTGQRLADSPCFCLRSVSLSWLPGRSSVPCQLRSSLETLTRRLALSQRNNSLVGITYPQATSTPATCTHPPGITKESTRQAISFVSQARGTGHCWRRNLINSQLTILPWHVCFVSMNWIDEMKSQAKITLDLIFSVIAVL